MKTHKICPSCKKLLLRQEHFGTMKTKSGVFNRAYCFDCERVKNNLFLNEKRKDLKFKAKRNLGSYTCNLKKKYGFSIEEYNLLLKKQKDKCAICGSKKNKIANRSRLEVDHCHKTGKIRGLLCSSCNRSLGLLGENVRILKRAIIYLSKPK